MPACRPDGATGQLTPTGRLRSATVAQELSVIRRHPARAPAPLEWAPSISWSFIVRGLGAAVIAPKRGPFETKGPNRAGGEDTQVRGQSHHMLSIVVFSVVGSLQGHHCGSPPDVHVVPVAPKKICTIFWWKYKKSVETPPVSDDA